MGGLKLCLFLIMTMTNINAELVNVHLLFRHGDRSPIVFLPKEPSAFSDWPMGPGQLTFKGMKQQFDLGSFLKDRYGNLIDQHYDPLKVHVRSTDVDRTLMSAQANLAGLFMPNSSDQLWNKNLSWYPVPVHTVSGVEDILLTDAKCPRIDQIDKEIYNLPEVKNISQDNAKLFAQIKVWTGQEVNLKSIWKVHDYLFCGKSHNFTNPIWNTPEVWKKLDQLNVINWKLMFYNQEIVRLKMGLLIHRITRHFHRIRSGKKLEYGQKMMVYSGHDTDVAGVLSAFGLFKDGIQPSYASCVMIELHRNQSGLTDDKTESNYYSWFVRFHYRNSSDLYTLQLPGCPTKDCPLHKFKEILSTFKLKSDQRKGECILKESDDKIVDGGGQSFLVTSLMIFLVLVLIFSILGGILIVRKVRMRRPMRLIENEEDVY